jgi:hypothetical protein
MKTIHDPASRNRRARPAARLALAALASFAAALGSATQWDLTAGDYHTHLLSTDTGFQLHLHDKATHGIVDTSRAKVTATLLAGGKREVLPVRVVQKGILEGSRRLQGDWTLLVRVEVPGHKPAQLRYSSKMKPGSQDGASDHAHGHDHDHDHAKPGAK